MLRVASGLAVVALLASLMALLPGKAAARDPAAIRACGGPARSFNQCLQVCSCMGGKSCFKACGNKEFSKAGHMLRKMERAGSGGGKRAMKHGDGSSRNRGFR